MFYKLGDAFARSLMTPFLLKGMAFGPAEVGVVNKVIGLWLTVVGALVGGAVMLRAAAVAVAAAVRRPADCSATSRSGGSRSTARARCRALTIPDVRLGFVQLRHRRRSTAALLLAVAFENLSGGMGTAAFVAFLMSLTNQRFTATQFALLSAFASIGRVWVGPLAGVLAESIGWPTFFIVSTIAAAPALALLWWLRSSVRALEAPWSKESAA